MKRWAKCRYFVWSGAWETTRNGWDLKVWKWPYFPWAAWRSNARLGTIMHNGYGFKTRIGAMRWATAVATGKRKP